MPSSEYFDSLKFFELNISETAAGRTAFILETVCSDEFDHFLKAFCELFKILLVEENLVLVVCKMAVVVYLALAFCDRQVEIIAFGSLDVKEVCTLSSSYRF
jgi:hypothetical protein